MLFLKNVMSEHENLESLGLILGASITPKESQVGREM